MTPDVNIPDELLEAQRNNNLVIFAGAGVSAGSPSNLPLFDGLASQIGDQAGRPATKQDLRNPDRFLGNLAEATDVHQLAFNIIGADDSFPNSLHRSILRVATAGGNDLRLVTTNYDLHFSSAAQGEQIVSYQYEAPALPMGDDFSGIVHLHGSLRQEPRRLILTDENFGHAYLTDAWATQFLNRMFRKYTVLFIGYSHSDSVMDYLARGLSSDSKQRFAFAPDNDLDKWRRLQISPISYHYAKRGKWKHLSLNNGVEKWAKLTNMGLLEHRQLISELVSAPPPEDPVDIDYLKDALTSDAKTVFFAEFARGELWLSWAENQSAFQMLFNKSRPESSRILARWFVEHFILVECNTQIALKTVQVLGGEIGQVLWQEIASRLRPRVNLSTKLFQQWVTLLIATVPNHPSEALDYLLVECKWPDDQTTALLLLEHFLLPQMNLGPTFSIAGGAQDSQIPLVRPQLRVLGDDYWLLETWNLNLKNQLERISVEIAGMAAQSLWRAFEMQKSFSAANRDWDPSSFSRSAIEPHEQDNYPHSLDAVIDMTRDSILYLFDHKLEIASGYVAAWSDADSPLLRRIAVHAWSHRSDKSSDEKIAWLLQNGRLLDHSCKHEIFQLIKLHLPNSRLEIREALVAKIVDETPSSEHRDYSVFNFMVWITAVDPQLEIASTQLARIRLENPDFGPREHPDLDHWMSTGMTPSPSLVPTEDLHERIEHDAQLLLIEIFSMTEENWPGVPPIRDAMQQLSSVVTQWPGDGITLLSTGIDLNTNQELDLWCAVIAGWGNAKPNEEQWSSILKMLESRPAGNEVARTICTLLEFGSRKSEFELPFSLIPIARNLAKLIWIDLPNSEDYESFSFGWYGYAINSSAGALAQFWVHSISSEWRGAGDSWAGANEDTKSELTAMLIDPGSRGAAARAIFGSQLLFLFSADEQWCLQNLLPIFEWTANVSPLCIQAWDGYLQVGRWNERLLQAGLLELLRNSSDSIESRLPFLVDKFCQHMAAIALYSEINPLSSHWLAKFIAGSTPKVRESWAHWINQILSSNTMELGEARWNEWIHTYWNQRLRGIPARLSIAEASTMAAWTPNFGEGFPDAVKLVEETQAPLEHRELLVHKLVDSEALTQFPLESIGLLSHLLANTNGSDQYEFRLKECVEILSQHSDYASLRPLIEAAIRAGYLDAASWIDGS